MTAGACDTPQKVWKSLLVITLEIGCGGAPANQAPPASPEPTTYPNPAPPDPCVDRVNVAMSCFDLGADPSADCARVVDAKEVDLKDLDAACRTSLASTCAQGCSLAHGGQETREHFFMLMTSPPP